MSPVSSRLGWKPFVLGLAVAVALVRTGGDPVIFAQSPTPPLAAPSTATTVQLPTFQQFSIGTSVLVPDRGSLLLGGVHRAASGSASQGVPGLGKIPGVGRLFQNRASGHSVGASNASVSVWVHDFQAMDQALLAEAAARRNADSQDITSTSQRNLPRVASTPITASTVKANDSAPESAPESALESVRTLRARGEQEDRQRDAEVRDLLAQGDRAETEGKPGVARLFYQMALRRSPATMQLPVQTRLQLLATKTQK